jgi:hypothetical protein
MVLPYGILDQYSYFVTFLNNSLPTLHIKEPSYETVAILDIAIQDWERDHGSDKVRIQYYESDSCTKRILSKKGSILIKRILLDRVYTSGWVWKNCSQFVSSVRPGL